MTDISQGQDTQRTIGITDISYCPYYFDKSYAGELTIAINIWTGDRLRQKIGVEQFLDKLFDVQEPKELFKHFDAYFLKNAEKFGIEVDEE